MKTINLSLIFLILLSPIVFADVIAPPFSMRLTVYGMIGFLAILVNYGVNFIICWPLSNLITKIKAKPIAKGLLIITPIMFVLEILIVSLIQPWTFGGYLTFGLVSFPVIFLCYFIVGKKMWKIESKHAVLIGILMGIITNPAYLATFF
ncbi:MAG: hypothetical protein V3V78_01555 [Candidatus Woesearchaeota archaeon]